MTVMTCEDDPVKFRKLVPENRMLWSVKLDGVRTMACDDDGLVSFWSRSGKAFPNFQRFACDITNMAQAVRDMHGIPKSSPVWFDGEMTAKDAQFKSVMQQLRRHEGVDPLVFEYHLFDCPTIENRALDYRLCVIEDAVDWVNPKDIHVLPHYMPAAGWKSIERMFEEQVAKGKEGIIVKDSLSSYQHKKSRSWLKMKMEDTLDLPVIGTKPGKGKYTGLIGALTCLLHNGKTVDVSGFSDSDRVLFSTVRPEMIKVKHNGETSGGKLRHPRFIRARDDK